MALPNRVREARLPISGLGGPPCAERVERALMTVDGVASAVVAPHRSQVTVVYDSGRTGLSALERAVQRVGCGVVRRERAVLRLGTERTRPAANAVSSRTKAPVNDDILQELIAAALERAKTSYPLPDTRCPLACASEDGGADRDGDAA
jgi:Cu+-exporting ATPase